MRKGAKQRTPQEKQRLRQYQQNQGRGPAPRRGGRPQFSLPEVQLPQFLMDLLGGGEDYVPRSSGALQAEAAQIARGQVAPALAQIGSAQRQGSKAIGELTREVAGRMAPIAGQTGAIYQGAMNQTQGFEQQMANMLRQSGLETQQGLEAQAQQAGSQAAIPMLQSVGQEAAGGAAASFALGGTALQRLAAEGAAQQAYGARLPGVASLGGQAALAALAREATAASAGVSAQLPGLQADTYRMLRSEEDSRADAANQRRGQLASALMDWNQNLQNIGLQTYITDLGFFGDRQEARQSARQFMEEMGLRRSEAEADLAQTGEENRQFWATFGQNQSQFEATLAEQRRRDREAAAADTAEGRRQARDAAEAYKEKWRNEALDLAKDLSKGYYVDAPGGGGVYPGSGGGSQRRHRNYTYQQAYQRLSHLLSGPLGSSSQARRFGLKPRLINQIIAQALGAGGFSRGPR